TSCRAASLRRAISNFIDNAVEYVGPATVSLAPEAYSTMTHRHYETFELPEVPDRLLPDKLAITFLTNRDGDIVSLSAPLETMVKDIVFVRLAAGDCTLPTFRQPCVGSFQ